MFGPRPTGGEPPEGKFGPGMIGHATRALIGLFVAAAGISWAFSAHESTALLMVGILAIVFVVFFVGILLFARKYPDIAALGGSEWRQYQETLMGAKDPKIIDASPNVEPPVMLPPRVP